MFRLLKSARPPAKVKVIIERNINPTFHTFAAHRSDMSELLSKPQWSVRSLLPSSSTTTLPESDKVTLKQLKHLLRLSALPLPTTKAEEDEMLSMLQSQVHFVQQIQSVDTAGVEPLSAIRDESPEAVKNTTITMEKLKGELDNERVIGRNRRIVKKSVDKDGQSKEAEDWDTLGMASKRVGRYFVVESEKKTGD
jgi:Asp-tRNA(Asn)/Glu-tRNA(Gln) amidotransferase C subunit